MVEDWRDIIDYEGLYQVSSAGHVRRSGGGRGAVRGRVITAKKRNGYLQLDLSRCDKKKRCQIHRLVAMAFLGRPTEENAVVNHIDGCKTNNAIENLEWATYSENNRHAYATGLKAPTNTKGERNGRSKLTAKQVDKIRLLHRRVAQRALAKQFGVSRSLIQRIHQGKAWAHLTKWPADLRVREWATKQAAAAGLNETVTRK